MSNNPERHHRKLERLYRDAPINAFYEPKLTISEGTAELSIDIRPRMLHAADAAHGRPPVRLARVGVLVAHAFVPAGARIHTAHYSRRARGNNGTRLGLGAGPCQMGPIEYTGPGQPRVSSGPAGVPSSGCCVP